MSIAPWYSSLHLRVPNPSQVPSAPFFHGVLSQYHGIVFISYGVYSKLFSYYRMRQESYWSATFRVRPGTLSSPILFPWCISTPALYLQYMFDVFHKYSCVIRPATILVHLGLDFPVSASSLSFRLTVKFNRLLWLSRNVLACQISPFSSTITEFLFSFFTGTVSSPEAKTPVTGKHE